MNKIQSYIYMGEEPTLAVLFKGTSRVEILPGDVVESDQKLSNNFMLFNEDILSKYDENISHQEEHIKSAKDQFTVKEKDLKEKHEKEREALKKEKALSLDILEERLEKFLDKREIIRSHISKAQENIDLQIEALQGKKEIISDLANNTEAKPVENTEKDNKVNPVLDKEVSEAKKADETVDNTLEQEKTQSDEAKPVETTETLEDNK